VPKIGYFPNENVRIVISQQTYDLPCPVTLTGTNEKNNFKLFQNL